MLSCSLGNFRLFAEIMDHHAWIAIFFFLLCLFVGDGARKNYYDHFENIPSPVVVSSMTSLDYKYMLVAELTISSMLLLDFAIEYISNITIRVSGSKSTFISLSVTTMLLMSSCVLKILVNTEINATSNAAGIMGILGAILQLIGSVAILYTSFRWCRMLYSISKIRQITTEEWDCTIYILLISLMLIELWIFNAIFNASTIREYTVMHLLAIEISFTSFAAIQAMYQRSVLRQQSIKFKARSSQIALNVKILSNGIMSESIYRRVNINPNLSYDTHDDNVIVNKSSKSVVDWKTSSRADGKVVPMEYQDTTYTMMKKKTAKSPISVDEKIKSPLFPATQTMNNHTLWGLDRDLETSTVKSISFQQQQQQQQHCCNPLVTLNLH
eukprot:gene8830-18285_t